ncbi:hypothetical protein COCNU_scaffold023263G000010 [Cocos nucifera]|nr:hypothetical protein [Cocos nucifera]
MILWVALRVMALEPRRRAPALAPAGPTSTNTRRGYPASESPVSSGWYRGRSDGCRLDHLGGSSGTPSSPFSTSYFASGTASSRRPLHCRATPSASPAEVSVSAVADAEFFLIATMVAAPTRRM